LTRSGEILASRSGLALPVLWWKPLGMQRKPGLENGETEHLRVRARGGAQEKLDALQAEIAGEIARALGRTEEALKLALAELELRRANLAQLRTAGASAADLRAAIDAFNQQRRMAEQRRLDLVIHREAAGFRRNQGRVRALPDSASRALTPCSETLALRASRILWLR
jgi:hypothetical protein